MTDVVLVVFGNVKQLVAGLAEDVEFSAAIALPDAVSEGFADWRRAARSVEGG
jgi:hypothetical protein